MCVNKIKIPKFFFTVLFFGILIGTYLQGSGKLIFLMDFCKKTIGSYLSHSKLPLDYKFDIDKSEVVQTHYYNFTKLKIPTNSTARYGGIDKIGRDLIFIDGEGKALVLKNDRFETLHSLNLPNNRSEFVKNFKNIYGFGILDILVLPRHNQEHNLYVSAIDYNSIKDCYFISLWSSQVNREFFDRLNFKKIYSTTPCIARHKAAESGFAGTSAGGKLVSDGVDKLFLSTGDFYFDGVNDNRLLSRENNSDYGKILSFSIKGIRKPKTVAIGLRNPEGLFYTHRGIFETEHGPQGGDELNLVPLNGRANDYGWPFATLGVDYGTKLWPFDLLNDNHFKNNKFTPPVFAWLPSIGVSNLIQIQPHPKLSRWSSNLLVSSLKDESLYRVVMDSKDNLHGIERVSVNFRVRDLVQIENSIYLLEDSDNPAVWKLTPQSN